MLLSYKAEGSYVPCALTDIWACPTAEVWLLCEWKPSAERRPSRPDVLVRKRLTHARIISLVMLATQFTWTGLTLRDERMSCSTRG